MDKFRWFMLVAFISICVLGWTTADAEDVVLPSVSISTGGLDLARVPRMVVSTICVDGYKWVVFRTPDGGVSAKQIYREWNSRVNRPIKCN